MDHAPLRPTRALRSVAAVMLGAVLLTAAVVPPVAQGQGIIRPVVIDTDLGADDILALAWMVNEPSLDIQAILVSGTGLADCRTGVPNLRALLVALDATGPEVGCGATQPLGGGTPFPAEWRAQAAGSYGLGLPPAPDAAAPWRSSEAILGDLLDAATNPLAILSLGPPTTLASVLADRDRAVRVASITAMLGALDVPGNVVLDGSGVPTRAEWNAHADPIAVEGLFTSGAPLLLVPLDATNQVPLSQTLIDGLRAGGEDPSAAVVARLFAAAPFLSQPGWYPRDPLAAVALTHPEVIETRERVLVVETAGPDSGALTMDETNGLPAQVALTADRTAFEVALLAGIRGEDGGAVAAPTGTLTIKGGAQACELDTGGTSAAGLAIIDAISTDEPLEAALVGLGEGHDIADLEALLLTTSPTIDPPDWLLLAAYLVVEAGSTTDDTVEVTPGDYVAICITGDGATPRYLVAPTVLTILE